MKESDIIGLSPVEIQNKFSLPTTPTHICDVTIPAGTKIYTGIVNPLHGYTGMGIQFDLDWQNQSNWFTNLRPLP